MSATSVNPLYPIFTDTDGQPLENGYIWIGTVNLDPQGNPINVYWDSALTQVAGQPIRTINGYPSRNGSPSRLFVNSEYSIRVQNKNGTTVASVNNNSEALGDINSALVTFIQSGTGAVSRTVQSKLRDTVSVKDFGAVGDGVASDASALQAAFTYAATNKKVVEFVSGETYNCAGVTLDISCNVYGNNATIKGYLRVTGDDLTLRDFHLIGTNATIGLYLFGSTTVPTRYYRQKIQNLRITFDTGVATANSYGLYASNIDNLEISGCNIQYGVQLIGCTDYLIDGNILDGNNYANNNELIHASLKSVGQIINNTFKDSLDNYIDLYSSGAKTIVANNRFLGCKCRLGTAIEIKVTLTDDPVNTSSNTNGWSEQIILSGNYFGNTVPMTAGFNSIVSVFYLDSRASPSFSWADVPRNIIIADNIFDGLDTTALGAGYALGVYLNTVAGVVIQGNTFRDFNFGASTNDISSCVWIENSQDVIVDGNRMSSKNGTGVSLHRDCTNITVSDNNMLQDLNKSQTLSYGIRITKEGTRADPTVTYSKFSGNTVYCSIAAFRQLYYAAGYMNDCVISGNIFQEQSSFQFINRCIVSDNKFYVGATRPYAAEFGTSSAICAHNTIVSNQVESNTTTQKPGINITRMRGSNVNGNTVRNATYGMVVAGTNVAGELDYLNIKDNFSISQTQPNFPTYVSMAAGDTATLQAVNNQKIT